MRQITCSSFLQFLFFFPLSFNSNKKTNAMSGLTRVVSSSDGDDSYEPKVILITGAAGFIGSHTALRLVKNLPNVRVSLSRFLQVFDFQVFQDARVEGCVAFWLCFPCSSPRLDLHLCRMRPE